MKRLVAIFITLNLGITFILISFVLSCPSCPNQQKTELEGMELVEVVVAAEDIPAGTLLSNEMLSKGQIPRRYLSVNAVRPPEKDDIIGQSMAIPVKTGEIILWSYFVAIGTEQLSQFMKEGERLLTLSMDAALLELIHPNDHVDFIATFNDPKKGSSESVTILQNVVVMATIQSKQESVKIEDLNGSRELGLITAIGVLVTPEEAQILTYAQKAGSLTLSLRNPEDAVIKTELMGTELKNIQNLEESEKMQEKHTKRISEVIQKQDLSD